MDVGHTLAPDAPEAVPSAGPPCALPSHLLLLPGAALKLYLVLLHLRDARDTCPCSCRALSRHSGLARQTIPRALGQLQSAGLILPLPHAYRVETGPLAALLSGAETTEAADAAAAVAAGPPEDHQAGATGTGMGHLGLTSGTEVSHTDDPGGREVGQHRHPDGRELCQHGALAGSEVYQEPAPGGPKLCHPGSEVGHLDAQGGTEAGHRPPRLTRTRASWSSSLEEDENCTPPPPPPQIRESPRGAGVQEGRTAPATGTDGAATARSSSTGPDGPDTPWLASMGALWARIAPGHPADPDAWFHRLWREHGPDAPRTVLRQFAEAGRRVSDLDHPGRYQAYFRTCCTRLVHEGPSAARGATWPVPGTRAAAPSGATPRHAPTTGAGDYRQDLRALYLADRQPGSDPHDPGARRHGASLPASASRPGTHRRQHSAPGSRHPPPPTRLASSLRLTQPARA